MTFRPLTSENLQNWVGPIGLQEVQQSIEYYEQQIAGLIKAYDRAKSDTKQAEAAHKRLRTALDVATADTRNTKWTRGEWFLPRWCTSLLENGEVIAYVTSQNIDAFVREMNGRMDVITAWKARALGAEQERNEYRDRLGAAQEELEDRREVDRQIRTILGLSEADTGTLGTIAAVRNLVECGEKAIDPAPDSTQEVHSHVGFSIQPAGWPLRDWEFRPLSEVTLQDGLYVLQLRTGAHSVARWNGSWLTLDGPIVPDNPVCFVAEAALVVPRELMLTEFITINNTAFSRAQLEDALATLDQKRDEIPF